MTGGPSPAQVSRLVAGVFDRSAETYDAVGVPWFTPIGQGLVAELAPQPGERALDIGCGRGAALWPLAEGVGATGWVTAIDLAPRMVELTRHDADARGLTNLDLRVMDAAAPDLPTGAYDVVAASLVLFFLAEPLEALRRWRELAAPGGRVGISTFGGRDPKWVDLDGVFAPYLPQQLRDARTTGARGPFGSDEGVAGLFAAAGLEQVRTAGQEVVASLDGPQHWVRWSWSHGQRTMWEHVPEDQRPAVEAQAVELLAAMTDADGRIDLRQRVRHTVGVRPAES
ncbi:MAG TPA: class I SAM-dependent methyltransferase [Actinomycetales bacterium]|jgi:ubiquinone/menaquinone biosynthesis C-methylase UbiE